MYRAALWDMDGTLFNTRPGIEKTLRETCGEMGLPGIPPEEVRRYIGPPIQNSMNEIYGLSMEKALEFAELFRRIYRGKSYVLECELYDGIRETLEKLRAAGLRVGVATLKKQDMAERICARYDLTGLVDCVYGTDEMDNLKKHDIIRLCCGKLGVPDPAEAVLIGDSRYDAEGAEKAGCAFLGVTYGFGFMSREDLEPWPHIGTADSPLDVCGILGIS